MNTNLETYKPGEWFEAKSRDDMAAFFASRLPAIREASRTHGYAIGVHGSMRRDLDLIAAPWSDGAADKDVLAHAIAEAACGMSHQGAYEWETKPLGRMATSIPCCWPSWHGEAGAGHIDLSVAPSVPSKRNVVLAPITHTIDSSTCNDAVYRFGESVGYFDMDNAEADALCKAKSAETGDLYDWHRFAGAVRIKVLRRNRVLDDGKWYWVQYEGLGKTYEAPALYKADAQAFYSHEFSGITAREVLVLKEA